MRNYTELSRSFHETIFDGGEREITLPLKLTADTLPGRTAYECVYTPPEDSGQNCFFIELDALSGKYDILCNGEKAASLRSLYVRTRAELTDFIRQGEENVIRIEVSPVKRPDGCFTFGGARIIMTDKTHFDLLSDGDAGISVRTVLNGLTAHVSTHASIVNPNNYDVVVFTLTDPRGRVIETKTEKPTAAMTEFTVEAPELWDGPHSPATYTVSASIRRDSVELDTTSIHFGIRGFEITKDGFFCLNGIKNPLCGVTLANFDMTEEDFEALAELDANCVRMNGIPADEDILTRCDDAGIIAWIDLPNSGADEDIDELRAAAKLAAAHPCVAVMSTASDDPGFAKKWCSELKQHSRYVSAALRSDILNTEGIIDAIPDVLEIHVPAVTGLRDFILLENRFAELRETHPEFRFAVFADSPECIFDRHAANAVRSDCSQEYFSAWHERFWSTFGAQKSVIGLFAGTLSDMGLKTGRTGLLTFDREGKKDAFWFYRAQFSASGFVRLCSSGQTSVTAKFNDIKCYSNTPAVHLTLNGKENKKYVCEKLSDCVYIFRDVRLKRRNNIIVVSSGASTDSEVIFRSRSKLSKK